MVPASAQYGVPGADDDDAIFADIVRSLGRDRDDVRKALAMLRDMAGGDFAGLDAAKAEATAMALLGRGGAAMLTALGRAVLQCYYRDDRVIRCTGPGATAALPEGPCAGAGRLVAAGRGSRPAADVARRRRQGGADMASPRTPNAVRPTDEIVDVLIIGSGASGAAVAWSLADTRMKILCLEQGDWIKPTDFPTNGRDWEARRFGDFDISPNRRGRDTDYPINDDNSPMKVANFNGVGGGTIVYTAHFPRMHPSDFRVRTLDGVADDWPIDYWTLEPYFAENDRMMGVAGLAGDPAYPPHRAHHAAGAAGQNRHALRAGDEQARLALVAVRYRHGHHGV